MYSAAKALDLAFVPVGQERYELAIPVIAVGGGYGTLSEIAIALKRGKPVFGYRTWEIDGIFRCATPEETVVMAVRAARL
ncbi:MAG: hypothetical protein LUP93_06965 [Methanomicrobiales archaeon]|nr:hypothetical protein [Methanomicrobiales archaeon]